jgi:hypothetical protein
MTKVPLTEGFYEARSLIADAQSCVNLYPEVNPKDSEQPYTLYPTPGLTLLPNAGQPSGTPTPGNPGLVFPGWRGLYRASTGVTYGVCGSTLYLISPPPTFTLTALGTLASVGSSVNFADNRTTMIMLDGTSAGYQLTLSTNSFSAISDTNFLGGNSAAYVDTFLISGPFFGNQWQSTLSNSASWSGLYIGAKSGNSDPLFALTTIHREIWLFGRDTTEVWYNVGGANLPFAILPGIFIQHGIGAINSLASYDLNNFWLSQDPFGRWIIFKSQAYQAMRISTHAIENAISKYKHPYAAFGFAYQQQGHVFYVLTFPFDNATWVYDMTVEKWHQRAWYNTATQTQDMWRVGCLTNTSWLPVGSLTTQGPLLCGDWENGNLYLLDLDNYTDFGGPIVREKAFPHIVNDGKRAHYAQFSVDMQAGGTPTGTSNDISLSWSDDRGASYGNPMIQHLGQQGFYLAQPKWSRLGMARDRVFKVSWSTNNKTALMGAWIDTVLFET